MDNIYHHGILGQRWGKKNGPPYPLGVSSHSASEKKAGWAKSLSKKTPKQKESESKKRSDAKNRGTLSDAELKSKIERLKMEKELGKLTDEVVSSGKAYTTQILKSVGTKVAVTAATGATLYALKAAISGNFDLEDLGKAVFNGGPKKK